MCAQVLYLFHIKSRQSCSHFCLLARFYELSQVSFIYIEYLKKTSQNAWINQANMDFCKRGLQSLLQIQFKIIQ